MLYTVCLKMLSKNMTSQFVILNLKANEIKAESLLEPLAKFIFIEFTTTILIKYKNACEYFQRSICLLVNVSNCLKFRRFIVN